MQTSSAIFSVTCSLLSALLHNYHIYTLCAAVKMSHGRPDPTLSAFIMINSFYCTSTGAPFHSPHHLPSKVTGTIPGLHPFSFRVSGPWGSSYWPLTTQLFVHLPQALHSQQSHCGPAGWWGWGGGVGSGIQIILFFFQVHPSHC